MELLIKLQFFFLFVLYIYVFTKLIKKGFSFSFGILFGTLYFIFIPMSVFVTTNTLGISQIDFSNTNLHDVVFNTTIQESIILILYLYSILIFIYFAEFSKLKINYHHQDFPLKWKTYFLLTLLIGLFIFIAAGIYQGGNWYLSREKFFKEGGSFALIMTYSYTAMKIIFITSILTLYRKYQFHNIQFALVVLSFSIIDVVLTGNRIYVFVLMAAILIELLNRYKLKILLFGLLIIPFGYTMSIYRHIRGGLFEEGIPSIDKIINLVEQAMAIDPPSIKGFLLGISESVNFNVIYEIFNHVTFHNALWGETFLKSFVFFIPRSLWSDKPLSITQIAGEWFAPQSEHLSLVTTIIGEAHANFYLFGIIFLPVLLFVTDKILKKMFSNSTFSNILLFILGLLIFRMPYSDILLVSIFIFIFYKLILLLKERGLI